jgi:hypothetical protein
MWLEVTQRLNTDRCGPAQFVWCDILEKYMGRIWESLTELSDRLSKCLICYLNSFGDSFFNDVKVGFQVSLGSDQLKLILSIFAIGIERCDGFTDRLCSTDICSFFIEHISVLKVMLFFCDLCHISQKVTDHVSNLGIPLSQKYLFSMQELCVTSIEDLNVIGSVIFLIFTNFSRLLVMFSL